jgi:hypothetical protein
MRTTRRRGEKQNELNKYITPGSPSENPESPESPGSPGSSERVCGCVGVGKGVGVGVVWVVSCGVGDQGKYKRIAIDGCPSTVHCQANSNQWQPREHQCINEPVGAPKGKGERPPDKCSCILTPVFLVCTTKRTLVMARMREKVAIIVAPTNPRSVY